MLYDISPPITAELKVFPGDTPPSREVLLDMKRGAHITLSTFRSTVHVGAHVDAPSHYGVDAPPIDRQPLELYLGDCQVIRVAVERGGRVPADAVPARVESARVLLATGTYPDPMQFNQDFAGVSTELVERLHASGVRLLGVDTPSVDTADSKDLPAHRACLACDIAILEGIVLDGVPEGTYELIALPLKLGGFDASPVRAILRDRPSR